MRGQYILIGQTPVPCDDLLEWAHWMETADRRVFFTVVGDYEISTVFLGLDHNFARVMDMNPDLPPILFETMIFLRSDLLPKQRKNEALIDYSKRRQVVEARYDQDLVDYQDRWATWSDAEAGHLEVVKMVQKNVTGCADDALPNAQVNAIRKTLEEYEREMTGDTAPTDHNTTDRDRDDGNSTRKPGPDTPHHL